MKKKGQDMNEARKKKRSIAIVIMMIVMAVALCLTMISCGGNDDTASGDFGSKTKTEQTADADKKSEDKAEQNDNKSENKSDSDKKASNDNKDSNKETQKSTTAATTQAKNVCYISIEGYCSGMEITLQGGDTAYSVLRRSGAIVSAESTQYGIYVEGINGRFAEGTSGWLYSVNGVKPNIGAGSYSIGKGDYINWYWGSAY